MFYKITDYRFKGWVNHFKKNHWFINPLLFRANIWLAILGWIGFAFACFYCTELIPSFSFASESHGEILLIAGTILFGLNLVFGLALLCKAVSLRCGSTPFIMAMLLGPISLFAVGFYFFWKSKNKQSIPENNLNVYQNNNNVNNNQSNASNPKQFKSLIKKGILTRTYNWEKYDRILIHPVDAWISIFGALLLPNIVYILLAALGITNQSVPVRRCNPFDPTCNQAFERAVQEYDRNVEIAGYVQIALLVVGVLVALWMIFRYKKAIFQDGVAVFFFFNSFQLLILMIPFSYINSAFPDSNDPTINNENSFNRNAWSFFAQTIIQGIYVSYFLWKSQLLKIQSRETFNSKNLGKTLVTIASCLALAYLANIFLNIIDNSIFSAKESFVIGDTSDNQETLNELYDKPITIALLFFSTVIVAPFCEEMAMRNGLSRLSIKPLAGFFASWIFFAAMHVNSNGDWEQIISYLGLSLGASLAYLITKSVYPSIAVHSAWNLIAFIQGVSTNG